MCKASFLLAPLALLLTPVSGCDKTDPNPDAPYSEIALEAPESYRARQAEYLDYCHANNGPGVGGRYGQICRVARGDAVHEEAIDEAIAKVEAREDTADFALAALVRMLYLDRGDGELDPGLRSRIEDTVLGAKYWIDEPGTDKMCYWSENHQILYHSNEMLAGQLFPTSAFTNNGATGQDHVEHAVRLADRWLDLRGQFGFSEWHSNVYFNEDIPALVNLADYAEDEAVRTKAAAVLDLLAFDLLNNYYQGYFATPHGRTYENKFLGGLSDSTGEAAWIMTGIGGYDSTGDFSGSFLATSQGYFTPGLLEDVATDTLGNHEHRQRDGINIVDGPDWGIGYEDQDDVIFWAGMVALAAPEVIESTVDMLDDLDLWDAFLFGDLPPEAVGLLEIGIANDTLDDLAMDLEPLSRGIALQSMSTYVYRTPYYQLAGAQDYNPGQWGAQTQMWQATLDGEAYVLTSYPTDISIGDAGMTFATDWTGSWMPRATFHRNVGVIQYRQQPMALVDNWFSSDHTHAFFPVSGFDEVWQEGSWTCGRKGKGYVALYSANPTVWEDDGEYHLDAPGETNVFIVEMGSEPDNGTFHEFVQSVLAAPVTVGDTVVYESPSVGRVEVGWEGPMTVAGDNIDLGPFPRWQNDYASVELGDMVTRIDREDLRLEFDFEGARRRLLELDPELE